MAIIPFTHAKAVGDAFIRLLQSLGIDPPARSNLESELLSPLDLIDVWQNPSRVADPREAELILRAAAGIHDFAAKVLVARSYPDFPTLIPHLRLLGSQKYPRASLLQNNRIWDDDTSRKMAELYVACLALPIGYDLQLDDPVNSQGDNPDVMFDLIPDDDEPPQRWAIAIKTVSTHSGPAICNTIEAAANQISNSAAERGLVLINVRDSLDHEALYNPPLPFANFDEALAALHAQVTSLKDACDAARTREQWDELFTAKTAHPILFLAQSLVLVPTAVSERTPVPIKGMLTFDGHQAPQKPGAFIAWHLNNAMQITL